MFKNSLFGFAFAGTFVGWFLGCVLGVVNAPTDALIYFVIGSMGLSGLVCGLLGLTLGALYPCVPPNLHIRVGMRWVVNRLSPQDQDGLRTRTQTVSFVWVVLLGVAFFLPVLVYGFNLLMTRLQSPELAAGAGALLSLAFGATILALGLVARNVLARVLESVVRRRPHLSTLVNPMGNTIAVLILGALFLMVSPLTSALSSQGDGAGPPPSSVSSDDSTGDRSQRASASTVSESFNSPDRSRSPLGNILRFTMLSLVAFLLSSILGEVLLAGMFRLPLSRSLQLFFLCVFCSVICALVGLRSPQARDRLAEGHGFSRIAVEIMRLPFDEDGDGFASVLGGGDCNDGDAEIHPGAKEVYGNPIDENCDGKAPQQAAKIATVKPVRPTVRDYGLRPPYSIVLLTIDGFRPDHLGFFGYDVETSPALDDLAGESIVFPRAYTTSSVMQMAMASLMAGKYPSEVTRDNRLFPVFGAENIFLAELLSNAGYHTAGFPSHWYFGRSNGLEQGFNVWQPYVVEKGRMKMVPTAETVMTAAVEHLSRIEADPKRPYFMWLHIIDPLPNYLDHLDVPRFGDAPKSKYDHEIRYVDTWLQWFIQTLRGRDDWNQTVLMVVGTSGTDFVDGGAANLSDGNVRVPMIIRVPGLRARPVEQVTSLIDLAPTILDLAGIEKVDRPAGYQGQGLMTRMLGRTVPEQPVYAEVPKTTESSLQMAWLSGNLKLNFDGSKNRWALFDVSRDPFEQKDLYDARPGVGAQLKRQLQGYRSKLRLQGTPIAP
ncbi:MAG: sulfatase-like hydrolase/transferase [Myxococcota bacterium]|nr:sulfatase-like hydrolase/transferase [Myxococcota bacterium]